MCVIKDFTAIYLLKCNAVEMSVGGSTNMVLARRARKPQSNPTLRDGCTPNIAWLLRYSGWTTRWKSLACPL